MPTLSDDWHSAGSKVMETNGMEADEDKTLWWERIVMLPGSPMHACWTVSAKIMRGGVQRQLWELNVLFDIGGICMEVLLW